MSQQSGPCAFCMSLGTSQCSDGSPVAYVPGCEKVVKGRAQTSELHFSQVLHDVDTNRDF